MSNTWNLTFNLTAHPAGLDEAGFKAIAHAERAKHGNSDVGACQLAVVLAMNRVRCPCGCGGEGLASRVISLDGDTGEGLHERELVVAWLAFGDWLAKQQSFNDEVRRAIKTGLSLVEQLASESATTPPDVN